MLAFGAGRCGTNTLAELIDGSHELAKEKKWYNGMMWKQPHTLEQIEELCKLHDVGYVNHKRIQHGLKLYVSGDIHTNTIEGFWSLLKRGISGVYHSVSSSYLQSYVNEYSFRYNHRDDLKPMFFLVLERISQV